MDLIILVAMAVAPGIAISLYVYLKDRHEPEPLGTLILGFICGVASYLMALGIGHLIHPNTNLEHFNFIDQITRAFILVGLVEEGSKFLFLRGFLYRNKNFNEPFDGIVYAVMTGMGFATAENLNYVIAGGGGTAVVRMFTAVPAHAVFAIIMGFFLGEAKFFPTSSTLFSTLALFFAVFTHGIYDYFLFVSFVPGLWLQAVASLIIAVVLVHYAMRLHQKESPFRQGHDE